MARLRQLIRSPLAIICVFLLSRAAVALVPFGHTGYPKGHLVINDVTLYSAWATGLVEGRFPATDPMWQYPPLAGPIFAVGSLLHDNPDVGFMLLAFAADAAIMVALLMAARRTGRTTGAWVWAVAAIAVGPVFLTRFDVIPTLFAVLGLLILARPATSGALLGIGAAVKVWPVLILAAVPRRDLPKALLGFLVAVVVTTTAVWAWAGDDSLAFLDGQAERGLQMESVAALPFLVGHLFGSDPGITYRYGSMEVGRSGTGTAAVIVSVVGLIALLTLAVARLTGRLERIPGPDVAFAAVCVSIVASRVFSPQYMIWLLGIGAVCLVWRRTAMGWPVVLMLAAAAAAQILYPYGYSALISGGVAATLLQVARIVMVVVATILAFWAVLRGRGYPVATSGSTPSSKSVNRADMRSQPQDDSIHARP